jgi:hypothetical protein
MLQMKIVTFSPKEKPSLLPSFITLSSRPASFYLTYILPIVSQSPLGALRPATSTLSSLPACGHRLFVCRDMTKKGEEK